MSPLILPLSPGKPHANSLGPATPSRGGSFGTAIPAQEARNELRDLARRMKGAKRIVVICGAGVSTAADIPDFRSAAGIYASSTSCPSPAKRARTARTHKEPSVKDLFHVNALTSDTLRPAQNALLTDLYTRASAAEPTAFHRYLTHLEEQGRLLRCYTQNIDGLEGKAGLRVGVPEKEVRGRKRRRTGTVSDGQGRGMGQRASEVEELARGRKTVRGRAQTPFHADTPNEETSSTRATSPVTPAKRPHASMTMYTPPSTQASFVPSPSNITDSDVASTLGRPPLPRVIPLHGLLSHLRCTLCTHLSPISEHLLLPASPIPCPDCSHTSILRQALNERQRPAGFLRPDIVLYGEEHRQGHLIGDMVEKDLKGLARTAEGGKKAGKPDFLMVVGTSLSIPGVKRMVKEFAKSVSSTGAKSKGKVVFVNAEPPAKSAEWEDVFDYWVKGDVQAFVRDWMDKEDAELGHELGMVTPPKTPRRRATTAMGSVAKARGATMATPISTPALSDRTCTQSSPSSSVIDTPSRSNMPIMLRLPPMSQLPPTPMKLWRLSPAEAAIDESLTIMSATDGKNASAARSVKKAKRGRSVPKEVGDIFGATPAASSDADSRDDEEAGRMESAWGWSRDASLTPLSDE